MNDDDCIVVVVVYRSLTLILRDNIPKEHSPVPCMMSVQYGSTPNSQPAGEHCRNVESKDSNVKCL